MYNDSLLYFQHLWDQIHPKVNRASTTRSASNTDLSIQMQTAIADGIHWDKMFSRKITFPVAERYLPASH